jgi:hypothetical protein
MRKAEIRSSVFREPNELLQELVAAGVELIYARDSALASALDVLPPSVEASLTSVAVPARSVRGRIRGLTYCGARKIYQSLKSAKPLQPILQELRDQIRRHMWL